MSRAAQELLHTVASKFEDEFFWHLRIFGDKSELFVSENIEKVTGYSPDHFKAILDKTSELIYKEDQPSYRKMMDQFRDNPKELEINSEYRIKRKDGRIIWVSEIMKVERDHSGKVKEYFGKVKDITKDQQNLMRLKHQLTELEETNNAKDNFISVLSHDLRAPFTSILGFSEILLNEANLSDKEKAEYLTYINDSSQNQLQLINYLLDWSRLQTNRMKIEPTRLNAQSIIFNCVSALTGAAVRKNINIKVNVPENYFIEADERLISIVITNLINNAVKYSNEGDSVDISAGMFSDREIEFVFVDEGIGIPETNKEKIFHISKIFSTAGTKGEKGTGLGLALARQIIHKHGGDIWFYSTEGVGSEFHFTVRISANTILLVKPNEERRAAVSKKITDEFSELEVITASNGFEALQIVEKSLPSLIITDHDLPLMNGLKLAESIRRMNKTSSIPVIAVLEKDAYEMKKNYEDLGIKIIESVVADGDGLCQNIKMFFI